MEANVVLVSIVCFVVVVGAFVVVGRRSYGDELSEPLRLELEKLKALADGAETNAFDRYVSQLEDLSACLATERANNRELRSRLDILRKALGRDRFLDILEGIPQPEREGEMKGPIRNKSVAPPSRKELRPEKSCPYCRRPSDERGRLVCDCYDDVERTEVEECKEPIY